MHGNVRRAALFAAIALSSGLAGIAPATAGASGAASAASTAALPPIPDTTPTADLGVWGDFVAPDAPAVVVTQPDGSTFHAQLTPAEIGGDLELDGYTIGKGADGWWRYASHQKQGRLTLTTARAGVDSVPAGLRPGAGRTPSRWSDGTGGDIRAAVLRQLQIASARAQQQAMEDGGPRVFRFPVLMLATWWDPAKGQTGPQFQPGTDTPEYVQQVLDGFGGNPRGSLTEFYFESSFGQFLVQVDVFGPFVSNRSREDRCYYGDVDVHDDSPTDDLDPTDALFGVGGVGAVGMAAEAVPQADPTVNFADYDNDGDGYVDFMGVVHSGADMAVTGDPCNTWSHALPVSALGDALAGVVGVPPGTFRAGLPTSDGVLVDRVFTMPEFDQVGGRLQIGVAAHEMAHALGEPDYYAPNGTSPGTGDYDIMSGGSYLGNPDGSNPAIFNPASRVFQGWLQPTIVRGDVRRLTLQPRNVLPLPGYTASQADPNLVLVPTRWIRVGDTDEEGHTWTDEDVYGLALDGDRGYVIEGYYLELSSRTATGPSISEEMSRSPYFDKGGYGGGLLAWRFDYWKRSNTYFGANDGQNVPDRMQMDVLEWDRNDNTQELQLNLHRGEVGDLVASAATGITSGTRLVEPGAPIAAGDPQAGEEWSGTVVPTTTDDHAFTVDDNPGNAQLSVTVVGQGDCTLQLFRDGVAMSDVADSGGGGTPETIIIDDPEPGSWTAQTGDFLGCAQYTGSLTFSGPPFSTKGAADTWSPSTDAPTGWAFTDVGPASAEGIDTAVEADNAITLDVVNLAGAVDVSPGFVQPAENAAGGRTGISARRSNALTVPIFSNGSVAPGVVRVAVRDATSRLVAAGTVTLGGYERKDFTFTYKPKREGAFELTTEVDPARALAERVEGNNNQASTLWAGPANPKVLVVDDDGLLDSEDAITGGLAALGVPYAIATRHVDAATMASYEAVVWESSIDRGAGQLDEVDRAAIATYLDGGGRLLLTSDRAAGAIVADGGTDFLHDYFGAEVVDTDTYGIPVDAVGSGDLLGSSAIGLQPFAVRPFMDTLALATSTKGAPVALTAIQGTGKEGRDGQLLGVRLDADGASGGFRSVLLSFNLSQVTNPADAVGALRAVLDHFDVAMRAPLSPETPIVYSTSVRGQVSGRDLPVRAIVLGGGGTPAVLYRHHGHGRYVALPMQPGGEPGTWVAVIPGSAVTPDGLDYVIRAGGVTDPRSFGATGLAHVVAVAIPELA